MTGTSFADCSPIFVVGAGRSGTTLLQLMLNAHSRISLAGEIGFFQQTLQLEARFPSLRSESEIDGLFRQLSHTSNYQFLPDADRVFRLAKGRLLADPDADFARLYRYILEGYASLLGRARFGEKTPENIRHLDDMVDLFPNCRIIHIFRDPRAIAASRSKLPFWSNDIVTNTLKWKIDMVFAREFVDRCGERNFLEVSYESLISDPRACLEKICRFVGEEYEEGMLEFHKTSEAFLKDEPWKKGTMRPVYSASLEKWREELSPTQVCLIEAIAGRQLVQHGYERSAQGLRARLGAPALLVRELARWARYKRRERQKRHDGSGTIHGTNRKFYQLLYRLPLNW